MFFRKSARSNGFANGRIQRSALHIAGNAPRRSSALFNSAATAGSKNNHWSAGRVIDREGKKKFPFDRDLLLHQNGFDWKLANFHRQHAGCVTANICRFPGEGHAADTGASGCPGLDFDYDFAVKFPGDGHRFISGGRGPTARNLESVSGKNGFALIFVKSCHDRVVFPRS